MNWNNLVSRVVAFVPRAPAWCVLKLVRFYQLAISPLLGPRCRFTPTCSEYCILAVKKYGVLLGLLKTAWRILRCNPFCKGGYDPP